METKHTQGEWKVSPANKTRVLVDRDILISDARVTIPIGREEAEANAKLIAAAPDLLEALKYVKRFLVSTEVDINFIDQAIKKATK